MFRAVLLVSLLTIEVFTVASADWEPREFTSTENSVIAIGTKEKPEIVQASDVVDAIRKGKEIRLGYATIKGSIAFHGEIKKAVSFFNTIFSGETNFSGATFSERVDFISAKFSAEADFNQSEFLGEANFILATFSKRVDFISAKFSGEADFSKSAFSGEANFILATFSERANFVLATFSERTNFSEATFSKRANFIGAKFSGEADFRLATFSWEADFSSCRFKEPSYFIGCLYSKNVRIYFSDVVGFTQMQFEWKFNNRFNTEYNQHIEQRGLKGHLEYNETFYIALIKNYQDMGWLEEADDAYYTYRVEKRNQSPKSWFKRTVEYALFDFPFGYGVKPWKLLRSFLIFWLAFSFIYLGFLRHPYKLIIAPKILAWNPARFARCPDLHCFFWALIHSFNILTPGVELYALEDYYLKKSGYVIPQSSIGDIWWARIQQVISWYLLALFLVLFGKIWIR